jgi:large subunit ribosomal protein L17
MRHRKGNIKLSRPNDQRLALLRGLVRSAIQKGHVSTTLLRARAASRWLDRCIEWAKADSLAERRRIFAMLHDHKLVQTLCKNLAPRFKNIDGGYARVLKRGIRKGDGATMAILTLQAPGTAADS